MLKVVGASLEQTRVTQFLLLAVILIAIFAIFFYEASPPSKDGRYAATAFYNERTGIIKLDFWGQNNDPSTIKQGVARAYYKPLDKTVGWASMEIETSSHYEDAIQARAAGMLEGSLSWQLIYWHWQNTVGATCMKRPTFCAAVKTLLDSNYNQVKSSALRYENENSFWYQVNLFYIQLEGLQEGWVSGKERSLNKMDDLTFTDFLWMNHVDDIRDFELMLENSTHPDHSSNPVTPPADLVVLRHLHTSDSQFLLAHQTSGLYTEMLRMMKRYTFSYHDLPGKISNPVPGRRISFTSYPGAILSQDDFYQIKGSSRLQVVSSRIRIHNRKEWSHLHDLTVLTGTRAMVANRLATNAANWAGVFSKYNSGSGNKAWLVMDHRTPDPNLWLIEQVPAFTNKTDITESWKQKGYWIGCGIPYSEKAMRLSGLASTSNGLKDLEYMTSIKSILEDGIDDVTNSDSMHALVTNPLLVAKVRGDIAVAKPSEAAHPITSSPTTNKTGIFQKHPHQGKMLSKVHNIQAVTSDPHVFNGVIDTKLAFELNDFKAVAGPLYTLNDQSVPPFQWSKAAAPKGIFHIGHPDVWAFPPVHPNFVW